MTSKLQLYHVLSSLSSSSATKSFLFERLSRIFLFPWEEAGLAGELSSEEDTRTTCKAQCYWSLKKSLWLIKNVMRAVFMLSFHIFNFKGVNIYM